MIQTEGRWMPREAAGNTESRMELYRGVHIVWGKKSPCAVCQPLTAVFVIIILDQQPFDCSWIGQPAEIAASRDKQQCLLGDVADYW